MKPMLEVCWAEGRARLLNKSGAAVASFSDVLTAMQYHRLEWMDHKLVGAEQAMAEEMDDG